MLPHERLTLRTSDAPDAVVARLAKMVAVGWFFRKNPPQAFRGTLAGRRFKIVRLLGTFLGFRYRNSWQPVIVGEILPAPEGTEVRVTMRLHAFVAAFTALWFAFVLSFLVILLRTGLERGLAAVAHGLLGDCLMALLAYAVVSFSEAKKARALLREGLGCHEIEGANRLVRSK